MRSQVIMDKYSVPIDTTNKMGDLEPWFEQLH